MIIKEIRTMKKLVTILLTAAMAATMSVSAFAEATELTTSPAENKEAGDYTIGVNGTYKEGTAADETISVDIAWDSMEFTYTNGGYYYDASEHETKANAEGGQWDDGKKSITITNHSNVAIDASFKFEAADGVTTTGTFYKNGSAIETEAEQKLSLASGEKTAANAATYVTPSDSISFGVSGAAISEDTRLGTITVTIAKQATD